MKLHFKNSILTALTITVLSAISMVQPAHSKPQATGFICGQSKDLPTTFARTPRGNVPVIRWISNVFEESGFDRQTRCKIVSQRFDNYFHNQQLTYLTTGRMNGQNVVCVARVEGGDCARDLPEEGLLFTLKPGASPSETLKNLMQVRVKATGTLNESTSRVYINMDEFVKTTPVDENADIGSSIERSVTSPGVNQSTPKAGVW